MEKENASKFNDVSYWKKGDIMWAHDKVNHVHPIVFIEKINNYSFKAAILSSEATGENRLIPLEYFCKTDENGNSYSIPCNENNQYLVTEYSYTKMDYWIKSKKPEGRLTDDGISFVESYIPEQPTLCIAPIKEQNQP
jgi:hypothetical protein